MLSFEFRPPSRSLLSWIKILLMQSLVEQSWEGGGSCICSDKVTGMRVVGIRPWLWAKVRPLVGMLTDLQVSESIFLSLLSESRTCVSFLLKSL